MIKALLPVIVLALFAAMGCSSTPVEPVRAPAGVTPYTLPFQMALTIVNPEFQNPADVPTDVPICFLIPHDLIPLFASYALAVFDVYHESGYWGDWLYGYQTILVHSACYEPADWDDWLTGNPTDSVRSVCYEPADWDDWLAKQGITGAMGIRRVHNAASGLGMLETILDPQDLYEPADWDDWLTGYEPAEWDDWLNAHTINDIAALN